MDNKDKEMIKRTVRGLYRDNLISFEIKDDKRICIEVQGKAYGDGYSSYVCARYKDCEAKFNDRGTRRCFGIY